nr:MarR family transcriptional regulator [Lachnospiraceae bacterium]
MENNTIVNNSDMNEAHRSHIVKLIHQKGVCSRAELAKATGLTQASITKITASLIDSGVLSE